MHEVFRIHSNVPAREKQPDYYTRTQHKSENLLLLESAHLMTWCRYKSETKRDILCDKSESSAKKSFPADTKGHS